MDRSTSWLQTNFFVLTAFWQDCKLPVWIHELKQRNSSLSSLQPAVVAEFLCYQCETLIVIQIGTMMDNELINDLPTVLCSPARICLCCVKREMEFWLIKLRMGYWLLCCPSFRSGVLKRWLRYIFPSCIITVY